MVGTGKHGSGCRLSLRRLRDKPMAMVMLHTLGLPHSCLNDDLELTYTDCLLNLIKEAGLQHVVLLSQDLPYQEDGVPLPTEPALYVPNDCVLALAREHPEFLAGVSIHPARVDAIEELERCAAQGAALLKLLPNVQNIDCSNPNFTHFWERLAELGLPLLAHTGGELSLPVVNKCYADPLGLKLPLECGVTVIAAHCGTNSLFTDKDFKAILASMFETYPRLYGDNSGMNTPLRSKHLASLTEEPFRGRIVHGSDVPIPISALWLCLRGLLPFHSYLSLRQVKNPLKQDIEIKRAIGFPEESFFRLYDLLPAKG